MATGYTRIGKDLFPYEIPEPVVADKPKRGRRKQASVEPTAEPDQPKECLDQIPPPPPAF